MTRESGRAIREAHAMPAATRWVPWSVVAEIVERPRDLPGAIGRARTALRNRITWARRDRRWWRSAAVRAWMGAAVVDGGAAVGTPHEIETIEAIRGGDRGIGVVMYGAVASSLALVDEGAVRGALCRGRAWSRPGQVEVGEPVDQGEIAETISNRIGTAWGRAYGDDEIATALASRGRGGWENLRIRISPARMEKIDLARTLDGIDAFF